MGIKYLFKDTAIYGLVPQLVPCADVHILLY